MAKKVKQVKRKKVVTWLNKTMNRVVLPSFFGGLLVALCIIALLSSLELPQWVYAIETFVFLAIVIVADAVILFVVIPRCRAAQALRDFENYDFTPYEPKDSETFTFCAPTEKFYFAQSPFDYEGVVELADSKAADDYFSSLASDNLIKYEVLRKIGEFVPFRVCVFITDVFLGGSAEKKLEGDYLTVTVTERYDLTFASDGAHIGGNVFPYAGMQAGVYAFIAREEARATATVNILLGDTDDGSTYVASFAFGTRIAAIIDKYNISVDNREIFDYILADPKEAFRQIGMKKYLKIKKSPQRRCNNGNAVI